MGRALARIRHDEVARMVKAIQSCGLPVSSVTFDGHEVRVNIGESGESAAEPIDGKRNPTSVKEVETL